MTSTGAERSRRYRAHRAGDHRLCEPARCPDAAQPVEAVEAVEGGGPGPTVAVGRDVTRDATSRDGAGPVSSAVAAMLGHLRYGEGDPRAVLAVVTTRLAEAIDGAEGDPPAVLVRELRQCMSALVEHPNEPADKVDELRARRAARRVDGLLAGAGGAS